MVLDAALLTLSIIRYGSRVKWNNPGKGVAPSSTPWCSSYRKGSLLVTLDYSRQLYLLTLCTAERILLRCSTAPLWPPNVQNESPWSYFKRKGWVTWNKINWEVVPVLYTPYLGNSMNEWTHFFIRIYISHTLFLKGLMFLRCVRDEWRQRQTAILTQLLLLTIARCVIFKNPLSTSSASWLGLLKAGWPSLWPSCLTNSTAACIYLYSFITPTCFRFFFRLFTWVHLWLTAQSRVNI